MKCPHCTQPIEYQDNHELTINCPHCAGLIEVYRQSIGLRFRRAYQQVVYMKDVPELFWPRVERMCASDPTIKIVYP